MNKTIELVTAWGAFEKAHPQGTVADFCAHYLGAPPPVKKSKRAASSQSTRYALSRAINRLSRLWMHFTAAVLKPLGLGSFEEWTFLFTVSGQQPIRKKDLIHLHYLEMSSGLLIIERLQKKGLLAEAPDAHDGRSRLLSITDAGTAVLKQGRTVLDAVSASLYGEMTEAQMVQCLQHLLPLQERMEARWQVGRKPQAGDAG